MIRPNKKNKCVSGNGSEKLGRVDTQFFFSRKKFILSILKGISPLKMHKIILFSRKPAKIPGFASEFRSGYLKNRFFFLFGLI